MSRALRITPRVTVDEFLAVPFGEDSHCELVDGEVVAQADPSRAHSTLQGALARHLGNALAKRNRRSGQSCSALTEAGIRPHFDPTHNYRAADLAVTCEPFDPDIPYTIAPSLLVEILSPTEEKAQRAKLHVYAAMPSVREILFLDSRTIRAELHRRDADNLWPAAPEVLGSDSVLVLETAGLELPLAELYRDLGF